MRRHFLLEEKCMLTDERLTAIMQMLPVCGTVADIGTDHGRLGAQLLLSGKCDKVYFTDISSPSLDKARKLIEKIGLQEKSAFFVGDGAKALPSAPDACVIAGMGGVTIIEILKGSNGLLENAKLILQPNVHVYEVRKYLMENGFRIFDEKCVIAARRKYILIGAEKGEASYSKTQLYAGPVLLKTRTKEFLEYALFRKHVIEKALKGASGSNRNEISDFGDELKIWEEVLG